MLTAAALVTVGCGESDDQTADQPPDQSADSLLPPSVVSEEAIAEQEEGSPERALLEWWQAFQFGDATQVVELTDPEALQGFGSGKLEDLVRGFGSLIGGLRVVDSRVKDEQASVRVVVVNYPQDGKLEGAPRTFVLRREDSEAPWLVDAVPYFEQLQRTFNAQ